MLVTMLRRLVLVLVVAHATAHDISVLAAAPSPPPTDLSADRLRDLARAIGDAAVPPEELLPHPLPRKRTWRSFLDLDAKPELPKVHASFTTASSLSFGVCTTAVFLQTLQATESMPARVREVLEWWADIRLRHQLTMVTACAFCMYAASDVLSQVLTQHWFSGEKKEAYRIDVPRLLRSGAISSFLSGFLAVFYFTWLERVFRDPPAWTGLVDWAACGHWGWLLPIICKVCVDVYCYEFIYDCLYVTLQALLRGDLGRAGGVDALRSELIKVPRIWKMSPRYWGPVDFVNFAFVGLRLRPLYNACFSLPWSIYLSSMANDDSKAQK